MPTCGQTVNKLGMAPGGAERDPGAASPGAESPESESPESESPESESPDDEESGPPTAERADDYSDLLPSLLPLEPPLPDQGDAREELDDVDVGIELDADAGDDAPDPSPIDLDVGALLPPALDDESFAKGDAPEPGLGSGFSSSDYGELLIVADETGDEGDRDGVEDDVAVDGLSLPPATGARDETSIWPEASTAEELGLPLPAPHRSLPWAARRWVEGARARGVDGNELMLQGDQVLVGGERLWAFRTDASAAGVPVESRRWTPPSRIEALAAVDDRVVFCATASGGLFRHAPGEGFEPDGGIAGTLGLGPDAHPGWRLVSGRDEAGGRWALALTRQGRGSVLAGSCHVDRAVLSRLDGSSIACEGPWLAELRPGRGVFLRSNAELEAALVDGSESATAFCLDAATKQLWLSSFASGPRVTLVGVDLSDRRAERLLEFRPPFDSGLEDEPHVRAMCWDAVRGGLWLTGAFGLLFAASPR